MHEKLEIIVSYMVLASKILKIEEMIRKIKYSPPLRTIIYVILPIPPCKNPNHQQDLTGIQDSN